MSFHSSQFSFHVISLVFLGIFKVDIVMAHQCYVCGPKVNISCDKFDPTNKSFIRDCPSAKGCSIQTHGNTIEMSCEDIGIRDCQTANNVQYCYCAENLCNGKTFTLSDDEDLTEEGSGTNIISNVIPNEPKKTNVTNKSSHLKLHLSGYIPLLFLLYN